MQEQQKAQDAEEDYQFWRQGIPFIYEQMISQELTWPSLTVQFLKGITIDENGNQRHRFIHSTTTGGQEPEYLKICGVTLPTTSSLAEKEDFEVADERWKKQNCGIVSEEKIYEVPAEINRARIHPSKDNIVAAQIANSDIGLFNIDLGEIIYLNGQIKEGYGISWSTLDDKLISSSYDQLVYLWDCVSQKLISKFSHHTQIVEDVSWCPDSPFEFLSCSDDGTIALGDLRDSKIVNLINAHSQEVNCVQYNPFDNSNQFASGSEDCNTKIFDKRNMKELHLLEGHDKAVLSLQWSPHQSNYLITGSKDSKVILWNLLRIGNEIRAEDEKDGPSEMVLSHCGHKKQINDIGWSQNVNQLFISTDQDNIVQIWKIQNEILDDENDNDQIISKIIKGQ